MAAGLDIGESHLAQETVDPGNPRVRADQVVDRASLKTFVIGAKDYVLQLYRAEGRSAFTKAKSIFRDPNGPWRHGPVYLFMMEPSGYTTFHGAFPDKFEFQTPTTTLRDQVTGKLILPQIIQTATANEDGGFVKYYFDNPDDDTDSATVPKVTYAVRHVFRGQRPDGSTVEYSLIFGAGLYGDPDTVSEDVCPRPADVAVNPLEKPSVTAAQAAGSAENLKAFALAGKRYLASGRPGPELAFSACLFRHEGPWKAGTDYIVTMSTDGRVFFHSGNVALSGRLLKPAVWRAIAAATGAAALPTTGAFGKPDGGALPAQIGGGYAVGFKRTVGGATLIMAAGLDIGESHLAQETVDPGNPRVRADQVVDRASLKTFVIGAKDYVLQLYRAEGRSAFTKAKSIFRDPNGPWRHGPVYLFIMEPSGYTTFHGAFPDKFEFQTPTTTLRDQVTGKLILPQIIQTATANEDGGFVKYYFDNPDDDTDSATVPKVTYAVRHVFRGQRPDGSTVEYSLIFGAGLYGDPDTVSEDVCPRPADVAVNPLEKPSVTAAQVAGSAENLKAFALAGKRYLASVQPGPELAFSACLFRHEGPWKAGTDYIVTMSTDGRVFFHSGNMALSGRLLKPAVWGAIAAATGAAALPTTGAFGKPDGGALPAQIGGGYAVGFKRTVGGATLIMAAGLDIGESHLAQETVDPGNPRVRADQVVDRASLKTFVIGAKDYVLQLYRAEGRSTFTKAKSVLRDPNGPWRHGPVYLFIMEPSGYTTFHGAFPDKFEFQTPTTTLRDQVTGKLILPQIIQAATANEDGGFVRYYFDNPDDDSDSADVPKVTYAIRHDFQVRRADGSTVEYPLIFGAGFYLGSPEVIAARLNTAVTTVLPQVMRAVTASTVDAVSSRIQQATAGTSPAKEFRLGGASSLSEALLQNGQALGDGSFNLTRLLAGSSFSLPLNAAGTGSGPLGNLTLWGNGDYRNFAGGNLNTVDYDGDVVSANLGVDTRLRDDLLAGVSVTWARGAVDYTDADAVTGEFTSTLTSINPYVGWQASSGLNLWGTAGYGWGEVELDDEMAETQASDLTQQMVAAGVNGPLASSDQLIEGGTSSLRLKGETAFTWADLEGAGLLRSTNLNASRHRLMFEGRHVQKFASGVSLTPSFEIGMRYDGGDGDTGHSMELGGGAALCRPGHRVDRRRPGPDRTDP